MTTCIWMNLATAQPPALEVHSSGPPLAMQAALGWLRVTATAEQACVAYKSCCMPLNPHRVLTTTKNLHFPHWRCHIQEAGQDQVVSRCLAALPHAVFHELTFPSLQHSFWTFSTALSGATQKLGLLKSPPAWGGRQQKGLRMWLCCLYK